MHERAALLGRANPPIAIGGLSNWILDPAKMNRAVCLQRPSPRLRCVSAPRACCRSSALTAAPALPALGSVGSNTGRPLRGGRGERGADQKTSASTACWKHACDAPATALPGVPAHVKGLAVVIGRRLAGFVILQAAKAVHVRHLTRGQSRRAPTRAGAPRAASYKPPFKSGCAAPQM